MTPASRRTGRAAALSVAVSLATALLAAACSAPPAHHHSQGSSAGTGSGDTAPLLDGGIDRGIHVPGTVPGDHLNADPGTVTPHHRHHHATTESAALPAAGTTKRHPRTAHPRHARTRRR